MSAHTTRRYEPADTALRYLVARIEEGIDLSDALTRTVVQFRLSDVMADRLRRAYEAWDARVTKVLARNKG